MEKLALHGSFEFPKKGQLAKFLQSVGGRTAPCLAISQTFTRMHKHVCQVTKCDKKQGMTRQTNLLLSNNPSSVCVQSSIQTYYVNIFTRGKYFPE